LADGADRWRTFVNVVFLAHLPLAGLEGVVLGCVVTFLAKVKPEMLGATHLPPAPPERRPAPVPARVSALLAALALLAASGDVRAHRLEAEVVGIDLGRKAVTVYSYFETGDEPKEAGVKVYAADGRLLAEGKLDRKGAFTFTYERPEAMRVVVDAPGGHHAGCYIPAKRLGGADGRPPPPPRAGRPPVRGVLLGGRLPGRPG